MKQNMPTENSRELKRVASGGTSCKICAELYRLRVRVHQKQIAYPPSAIKFSPRVATAVAWAGFWAWVAILLQAARI